jgi:hypothetical protein
MLTQVCAEEEIEVRLQSENQMLLRCLRDLNADIAAILHLPRSLKRTSEDPEEGDAFASMAMVSEERIRRINLEVRKYKSMYFCHTRVQKLTQKALLDPTLDKSRSTQLTCFTSTKVPILTQKARVDPTSAAT